MPFFFSRDKGRFLGLSIPRMASQSNRIASDALASQPLSPSTSSPSTLSPSSPYASSPSTSSPSTSPYSPSPGQSFHHIHNAPSPSTSSPSSSPYRPSFPHIHDAIYEYRGDVDRSGNNPSMQQVPHIESVTSNYESPPPYEAFRSDDLASSTFTARERAVVPLPPVPSSPLRSPTLRFTAATEVEGDECTTTSLVSVDASAIHRTAPPRLRLQPPAGARLPFTTTRRELELYGHAFSCLKTIATGTGRTGVLAALDNWQVATKNLGGVQYLVHALRHRDTLSQLSTELGVSEDPRLQIAFEADQTVLTEALLEVLNSPTGEQSLLALEEDAAQGVLDIIQYCLNRGSIHTSEAITKAHKVLGKLSEKCCRLPSDLIISGVTQRAQHASFLGGYGDVHQAMLNGNPVALKHMRMFQDTNQRDIRRGTLVWHGLRHVNVVPLIGIDTESFPPSFCLVSPWMKNGTVNKFLEGRQGKTRQHTVNRLIGEIAQGLAYLHAENVVHGDLRGANILVSDAENACLTDFGLTVLSDASTSESRPSAGCARWMAPELLNPLNWGVQNRPRTPASDIYAFACVCLELYTGRPPFHGVFLPDSAVSFHVVQGGRPSRPAEGVIPDPVWNIMQKCWAHNFADRPTIGQIVADLRMNDSLSGIPSSVGRAEEWTMSTVESSLSPFSGFIDISINPRDYYLDLREIAEGPGGTIIYVARLADFPTNGLMLPVHIKTQDQQNRLSGRATLVAIKSVPILPSGNAKLTEVLHELTLMHDLHCENILTMDALYVDPMENTLWIRMELMTRSLSSIINLSKAGLKLLDQTIAGCTKDILSALEYLRVHNITPRNIHSRNILVNGHGFLKLTNLSSAVKLSMTSRVNSEALETQVTATIGSNAASLCLLVCDMAIRQRQRPPLHAQVELGEGYPPATWDQFMQMYSDIEDWSALSDITSRPLPFRKFVKMCFDPAVTSAGYQQLLESPFVRDACERPILAQLLAQCTAFETRPREQQRAR